MTNVGKNDGDVRDFSGVFGDGGLEPSNPTVQTPLSDDIDNAELAPLPVSKPRVTLRLPKGDGGELKVGGFKIRISTPPSGDSKDQNADASENVGTISPGLAAALNIDTPPVAPFPAELLPTVDGTIADKSGRVERAIEGRTGEFEKMQAEFVANVGAFFAAEGIKDIKPERFAVYLRESIQPRLVNEYGKALTPDPTDFDLKTKPRGREMVYLIAAACGVPYESITDGFKRSVLTYVSGWIEAGYLADPYLMTPRVVVEKLEAGQAMAFVETFAQRYPGVDVVQMTEIVRQMSEQPDLLRIFEYILQVYESIQAPTARIAEFQQKRETIVTGKNPGEQAQLIQSYDDQIRDTQDKIGRIVQPILTFVSRETGIAEKDLDIRTPESMLAQLCQKVIALGKQPVLEGAYFVAHHGDIADAYRADVAALNAKKEDISSALQFAEKRRRTMELELTTAETELVEAQQALTQVTIRKEELGTQIKSMNEGIQTIVKIVPINTIELNAKTQMLALSQGTLAHVEQERETLQSSLMQKQLEVDALTASLEKVIEAQDSDEKIRSMRARLSELNQNPALQNPLFK